VVHIVEISQDVQNYYIVMDLITGGELFDKIVEITHYSEEHASFIFRQLASVVDFLHDNFIVHRDLKVLYLNG